MCITLECVAFSPSSTNNAFLSMWFYNMFLNLLFGIAFISANVAFISISFRSFLTGVTLSLVVEFFTWDSTKLCIIIWGLLAEYIGETSTFFSESLFHRGDTQALEIAFLWVLTLVLSTFFSITSNQQFQEDSALVILYQVSLLHNILLVSKLFLKITPISK